MTNIFNTPTFEKDVFISYSTIDADRVLEFVSKLNNSGIDYFLDKIDIGWGESIVEKVFYGIAKSRYVIVFISDDSLKSPWVKKEIHNAFQREIESDSVVLLPIISCSPELFFEKFPFLKEKKFLRFDDEDHIVDTLITLLRGTADSSFTFNHPKAYYGPIWIRFLAKCENNAVEHNVQIRWGAWYRECSIVLSDKEPLFLTHSKGNDGDSIPIIIHLDKPAYVMIGRGIPNSLRRIDINPFWVDAKSRIKKLIAQIFLWP